MSPQPSGTANILQFTRHDLSPFLVHLHYVFLLRRTVATPNKTFSWLRETKLKHDWNFYADRMTETFREDV
jgi:hypothetical protein